MTEIDEMPYDSRALVQLMDKAWPHRCIRSDEDIVEAHRYAGKRELIDHLLSLFEQQEEDDRQRQFEEMTP